MFCLRLACILILQLILLQGVVTQEHCQGSLKYGLNEKIEIDGKFPNTVSKCKKNICEAYQEYTSSLEKKSTQETKNQTKGEENPGKTKPGRKLQAEDDNEEIQYHKQETIVQTTVITKVTQSSESGQSGKPKDTSQSKQSQSQQSQTTSQSTPKPNPKPTNPAETKLRKVFHDCYGQKSASLESMKAVHTLMCTNTVNVAA